MRQLVSTQRGFSLIELVFFILITSILAKTILISMQTVLQDTPSVHYNLVASQLADQCMEGFIGQRRLLGYSYAGLSCSASPSLPSVCSSPTGYTTSAAITCTQMLPGDSIPSKMVTVTVTGLGNVTLTTLLANY